MCCLTCSYFQAIEPPEHKAAREAGRCEGSCGKEWNWRTAILYVRNHKEPLKGFCRFNPLAVETSPWGACGQHRPVLGKDNGWGIRAFDGERDCGLMEWAIKGYRDLMRGDSGDWSSRRLNYLEEMNGQLRQQLAAARKRSASRLARLQKNKKPRPEPKLPEPSMLRLVAAE
jgi:hypothetical protein